MTKPKPFHKKYRFILSLDVESVDYDGKYLPSKEELINILTSEIDIPAEENFYIKNVYIKNIPDKKKGE